MYIPAAFNDNDTPSLHQQMEQTRLAILVTVLAFNLLGDGLRDAFDPKLKR